MLFIEAQYFAAQRNPLALDAASGRQAVEQLAAIRLGEHARIAQDDDAVIGTRSYEPTKSLLETQRGVRQHELTKRIAPARFDGLALCRDNRFGGHSKRKLGDQQAA